MFSMRKAFTLIELVVAVGVLAMVLSFASVIFKVSLDSHRTAVADAEIMRKLRVITEQLNADFKAVILQYPGRLNIETRNKNADCIAFLANGAFQSTRQYGGKIVAGNVASIFYGQAADPYPNIDPNTDPFTGDPKEKILVRIQTILTSDSSLPDSDPRAEYYKISLSEWQAHPPFVDINQWTARPPLDLRLEDDLVMYMAKGVDNFTIEWLGGPGSMNWVRSTSGSVSTRAFKFTFTLYDSHGVIKNGRTFTHIVYLGD